MKINSKKSIVLIFILLSSFAITCAAMHQSSQDTFDFAQIINLFYKSSPADQYHKPAYRTAKTKTWLNVRKGPGISHDIVHVLAPEAVVSIQGVCKKNWNQIKYISQKKKNIIGFVNSRYLSKTSIVSHKTDSSVNQKFNKADHQANRHKRSNVEKNNIQKRKDIYKQYFAKSNVFAKFECKTVRVNVEVDGVLTEKLVKTCKNRRNGSWGY